MLRPLPRRLMMALTLAMAMAGASGIRAQDAVTVFAAASLKSALDDIAAVYDGAVQISYAGSSVLARQIQLGAPADLFLSANTDWMDVLERGGLIVPGSRQILLTNRLVLIAGKEVPGDLELGSGADLAGALGADHLAMALVDAVPAGIYGRQALQSLGVWREIAPRVAQTDNVRAALMLVAIGEAPYGIVYATDAAAAPEVRVVGIFPADSHPPIRYPLARIGDANPQAAQAFFDFLSTPDAREIFLRHGFGLPEAGT